MRTMLNRVRRWTLLAAAGGSVLFLSGCDPTLKGTVEDGIITTSQSVFAAFLRALIELGDEANTATAQVLTNALERIVA